MQTTESGVLRARATELRRVARAIEATPAIDLTRHAQDDTWRGARPAFCVSTLTGHQHELLAAAHNLRVDARRFESSAADLDAAALVVSGPR